MDSNQIQPDMPVVCSKDGQFAEVDHMEGEDMIKLKRDATGKHHYIPMSWVASTADGKVKIDRPGEEAMQQWSESP